MSLTAAEKQTLSTKRALEALGKELGEDQATLEELYKAARDENELLEFKNYELQFKIQELENKQKNLLSAITASCAATTNQLGSDTLESELPKMIDQTQLQNGTPTTNPPTKRQTGAETSPGSRPALVVVENQPIAWGDNNATTVTTTTTTTATTTTMKTPSDDDDDQGPPLAVSGGIMDAKLNGQTGGGGGAAVAAAANDSNDLKGKSATRESGNCQKRHGKPLAEDGELDSPLSCIVVAKTATTTTTTDKTTELMRSNGIATVTSNEEADGTKRGLSLARSERHKPQLAGDQDDVRGGETDTRLEMELEMEAAGACGANHLFAASPEAASNANEKSSAGSLLSPALSSRDVSTNEDRQQRQRPETASMKCPSAAGSLDRANWHNVAEHENANEDGANGRELLARKTNIGLPERPLEVASGEADGSSELDSNQATVRANSSLVVKPTNQLALSRRLSVGSSRSQQQFESEEAPECASRIETTAALQDQTTTGEDRDDARAEPLATEPISGASSFNKNMESKQTGRAPGAASTPSSINSRDLAKSQPSLVSAVNSSQKLGMARIAMPVQRDGPSSTRLKQQQATNLRTNSMGKHETPLSSRSVGPPQARTPTRSSLQPASRLQHPMRIRSKSSLDQESLKRQKSAFNSQLPRRMGSSLHLNDQQSNYSQARHATPTQATTLATKRSSSCLLPAPDSVAKSELSAGEPKVEAATIVRRPARNYKSTLVHHHKPQQQQQPLANDKFVTQIPTLIDQSHANARAATSSTKVKRSIAAKGAASNGVAGGDKSPTASSRCDTNTSPATKTLAGAQQGPIQADLAAQSEERNSPPPSKDHSFQPATTQVVHQSKQPETVATAVPQDELHKTSLSESTERFVLAKCEMRPQIDRELSRSCVQMSATSASQTIADFLPGEAHGDDEARIEPPPNQSPTANGGGGIEFEPRAAGPILAAKSVDQLALGSGRSNGSSTAEGEARCVQCKVLRSKLEALISERNQLNEQLNELEEMENDSRLMSQKLAQQLANLEKQFEACKLDLKKSCESESKWRFQNKRLHFELRQRHDCIQNLQCQLNELRSKTRVMIRLQKEQQQQQKQQEQTIGKEMLEPLGDKRIGASSNSKPATGTSPDSMAAVGADSCSSSQITSYDSVYSKSSFSSSSDGCSTSGRGDSSSNNSEVDCCEELKVADLEAQPPKPSDKFEHEPDEVERGHSGPHSATTSSRSSHDELSDQHDDERDQPKAETGTNMELEGPPSPPCESSKDSANKEDKVQVDSMPEGPSECLLANSQQVQKKRISTARILRGTLVGGGSGQSASLIDQLATTTNARATSPKSSPVEPSNSDDGNNNQAKQLDSDGSASEAAPSTGASCQKARIARVDQDDCNESGQLVATSKHSKERQSGRDDGLQSEQTNQLATAVEAGHLSSKLNQSADGAGQLVGTADQRPVFKQRQELRPAIKRNGETGKSPIELALEGVNELERSTADEALQSLCVVDQRRLAPTTTTTTSMSNHKDNETREQPDESCQMDPRPTSGGGSEVVSSVESPQRLPTTTTTTAATRLAVVDSCDAVGESDGLARRQSSRQHKQQQQSATTNVALDLIDGLKQEVSNLRMRLVQANTLNDNLISELKAHRQPNNNANGDQMLGLFEGNATLMAKGHHQEQRQQMQQQQQLELGARQRSVSLNAAPMNGCERLHQSNGEKCRLSWSPAGAPIEQHLKHQQQQQQPLRNRRSSVIYVNGLNASVTHHHHHYEQQQQQQLQQSSMAPTTTTTTTNANEHNQSASSGCLACRHSNEHQFRIDDLQQQQQQAALQLCAERELADFLKFLQEKLHFHHGRTFELVNECQKLTMNALLASYNQQISLYHHQRVVSAGNQATRRADLLKQQQQYLIDGCGRDEADPMMAAPVRPPPRRRNRTIIEQQQQQQWQDHGLPAERTTAEVAAHQMVHNIRPSTGGELQAGSDQQLSQASNGGGQQLGSATSSALQVAKQTLFSLVPIYYSCNKSQQQQSLNNNNNKERISSETTMSCKSGSFDPRGPPTGSYRSSVMAPPENGNEHKALDAADQSNCSPMISASGQHESFHRRGTLDQGATQGLSQAFQTSRRQLDRNDIYARVNKVAMASADSQDGLNAFANQVACRVGDTKSTDGPMATPAATTTTHISITSGAQGDRSQAGAAANGGLQPAQQMSQQRHSISIGDNQRRVFQTINQQHQQQVQQQLASVKNSLSEEIERFRVHSNGQLLDLLTRQNWCESLITEKLRAIERRQQLALAARQSLQVKCAHGGVGGRISTDQKCLINKQQLSNYDYDGSMCNHVNGITAPSSTAPSNIRMLEKSTIYCNGVRVTQPSTSIQQQQSSLMVRGSAANSTLQNMSHGGVSVMTVGSGITRHLQEAIRHDEHATSDPSYDQEITNSFC